MIHGKMFLFIMLIFLCLYFRDKVESEFHHLIVYNQLIYWGIMYCTILYSLIYFSIGIINIKTTQIQATATILGSSRALLVPTTLERHSPFPYLLSPSSWWVMKAPDSQAGLSEGNWKYSGAGSKESISTPISHTKLACSPQRGATHKACVLFKSLDMFRLNGLYSSKWPSWPP